MSSTPTQRNGFDKQAYGDNPDLWGINNLNTDLDLIDESLDGITPINSTGGTYTLNATNFATNEARKRMLILTGVLAAPLLVVIPNVQKNYIVVNNTTGAFASTVGTSGGTAATVAQGSIWGIYCDGAGSGTTVLTSMPVNLLPAATAALNMNAQKITNLAAGTTSSDAVRFDQLPGAPYYTEAGVKVANFNVTAGMAATIDLVAAGASFTGTLYATPAGNDRFQFMILADGVHTFTLNGTSNTVKINNQSVDGTVVKSGLLSGKYDATTGTWITGYAPYITN